MQRRMKHEKMSSAINYLFFGNWYMIDAPSKETSAVDLGIAFVTPLCDSHNDARIQDTAL